MKWKRARYDKEKFIRLLYIQKYTFRGFWAFAIAFMGLG